MWHPPKFRTFRPCHRRLAAGLLVAPLAAMVLAALLPATQAGAWSHRDERSSPGAWSHRDERSSHGAWSHRDERSSPGAWSHRDERSSPGAWSHRDERSSHGAWSHRDERSSPGAWSHRDERVVFRPPVDAPVADPFRRPENPYGPGNRGVEYDTEPGQVVRAAAAGTVVFASAVAGTLHVTVNHGGGVISSYSYLQRISVRDGTHVKAGAVIGIAGERLHFGVRVDGNYTDPEGFIGVRRMTVRLVPLGAWRSNR